MGKLRQTDIDKLADGLHSDGDNLAADVNGNRRRWIFRYQRDGKRKEIGLGSLADVPLAMARKRAAGYRAELLAGGDPLRTLQMEREQERQAAAHQSRPTFGEVAAELHASIEAGFRNRKHAAQWITSLRTYCGAVWDRRCDEITTSDALVILRPIWLSKAETAGRVRQRAERTWNAAKARGLCSGDNPFALDGNLDHLLAKRGRKVQAHHAALPYARMPELMKILWSAPTVSNRALIILILTAVRSGELCGSDGRRGHKTGARWQEFDLETRLWTIPAERMKAGREHVVPLSEHAYALLKWVKAEAMAEAGGDEIPGAQFVFRATRHGTGGWLKPAALGKALSTALPGEAVTVHGMRSAFRDWAGNETATPREVIEEALSHSLGAVESAYRRGAAIEKRRLLMQTWCDYCSPAGK